MSARTNIPLRQIAAKRTRLNAWWIRLLLIAGSYVIAADVLPNLLLVVINSIGYLPYSDRPGPGWQMPHLPSGGELQFFGSFALLLLKGTLIYGSIFSVSGFVLGFCSLPRWALRVLAAPTAFLASGLMMAAGGWLIAISSIGVYAAAGFGALWGLFVFPRLVPALGVRLPTVARIALPIVMLIGGTYFLIKPLLPDRGLTNAKIEVIRRDNMGTELSKVDLSFIGASISRQVAGAGKYISINRMEFATDSRNQVRVLLIIDDDRPVGNTFQLPRSGDAIYRQHKGNWSDERIEARRSDISLELIPTVGRAMSLRVRGPCCSSISQSYGPYQ